MLDTTAPGYSWEADWEFVTKEGWATGNHEAEDYRPTQVGTSAEGAMITLQKVGPKSYLSGQLQLRKRLPEYAAEGTLHVEFVLLPAVLTDGSQKNYATGQWPAVWLLPPHIPWPTGGEIDLFELFVFESAPWSTSYSPATLHFGPDLGVDCWYVPVDNWSDPRWGLVVANYSVPPAGETVVIDFSWQRNPDTTWQLTQQVGGTMVWSLNTSTSSGIFENFSETKYFFNRTNQPVDSQLFAPGADGDPAKILSRAFSEPGRGMQLLINLAFGGGPWALPLGSTNILADWSLERSQMLVKKVQISTL